MTVIVAETLEYIIVCTEISFSVVSSFIKKRGNWLELQKSFSDETKLLSNKDIQDNWIFSCFKIFGNHWRDSNILSDIALKERI